MNYPVYLENDIRGSFAKNYMANYINNQADITDCNPNLSNSQKINSLLLKCDKEKEVLLMQMSFLKESYEKYNNNAALNNDKWIDSEHLISKAIVDLLSNAKEGFELNLIKNDLENDTDFMRNKLSQYTNIDFKNVSMSDRKVFEDKLKELRSKFEEKTHVYNQLCNTSKQNIQQRGIIIDFISNNAKGNCKKIIEQKIETCNLNLMSLCLIQELNKTKHENEVLKEKLGTYEKTEDANRNLENMLAGIDLLAAKNLKTMGIQPRILKEKPLISSHNEKNASATKNSNTKFSNLN